jgi:vacuolar iron transporter family protein
MVDKLILRAQKNEITEYEIYSRLSDKKNEKGNKKILCRMAKDELNHYNLWKKISRTEVKPDWIKVHWYMFLSNILGLSFSLRLMERGENLAIKVYTSLSRKYPISSFIKDEHRHEKELIKLIKEERVEYAGSIVLGLNDALVELTGALAGLTFALRNGTIIAVSGFIIGVAASMSMAASGYLQSREEENEEKNPVKSAIYTGVAYLITVLFLISPYIFLDSVFKALILTLIIAVVIIAGYTFYITTCKDLKFGRRFIEMAVISLTVALISFGIGLAMRNWFGLEI